MAFKNQPLAYRMRPETLDEFVGQEHLLAEGKPLKMAIEQDKISSLILWGPPGSGKTTIARLISKITKSEFIELSAVRSGKSNIEKAIQKSRLFHNKTILFIDEIHRFNKAQQDYLLPYVENGTITLIGATTENPSFEIISALLSRSRVFTLNALNQENILEIINRAIHSDRGLLQYPISISEKEKKLIARLSNGDARNALNILEMAFALIQPNKDGVYEINSEIILSSSQKPLNYDKDGEEHYNIISALHKSMRDSDANASVYWTMRMIEAGEDPKYIIRRMIRFASEDIGNADPQALALAVSAKQAVEFLGYPECDTALIQTAIYLARAPKSNEAYKAVLKSRRDIKETGNLPVPLHLRNAETNLMKDMGYGKGYKYFHDDSSAVEQQHLPDELKNRDYCNSPNP